MIISCKNPSQKYEKIGLLLRMERAGIGNQELPHCFFGEVHLFLLPLLVFLKNYVSLQKR